MPIFTPPKSVKCQTCNKVFSRKISGGRTAKFCSLQCYGESLRGRRSTFKGKRHSEESRSLIRQKRAKQIHPRLGKKYGPLSIQHKEKISLSLSGKKKSEGHARKVGLAQSGKPKLSIRGEKHWAWGGGKTRKRETGRVEYKIWRQKVFERDDWTCQSCRTRSGKGKRVILHADHIMPWAFFPEKRYDLTNGRTLCVDCHKKTDTFAGRAIKKYANLRTAA